MVDTEALCPPSSFTMEDRDRTADDRDRTSDAHDQTATARDARSEARDVPALAREERAGTSDADVVADRAGALRDRKTSAGDRRHSQDDRDAASADRVRAAVDRANLVVDGLTGAHQRAPGLAELERELVKARRTGQAFVLAFLDVDGLKTVNDTRGHAAGDDVLRQVVTVVRGAVRDYDLVVRYGGDEFVCGLLDLSLADAADRFAGTRRDLDRGEATFSVGLACFTGDETLEELIVRADAAMYEQRAAG